MNGRVAAFRINGDFANPIDANYRIRIEIVRLVGHAIASWIPVDGAAPVCINSAIVNACISVEVSHDVEVIDGTRRPSTIAEPNTRHCYTRRGGVGDYVACGIQQPGLSRNRESAAGSSSKGRDSTAIGSRAKENTEVPGAQRALFSCHPSSAKAKSTANRSTKNRISLFECCRKYVRLAA